MARISFTNTQVASSEIARNINRGVLLNLIRRRQPISRADLARISGLQRSTVSLITEQLIAENWVVYGPVGRLPRGRRPTFLRLNDRRAILVADLRPSLTTVAVADVNGKFLSQESITTMEDPEKTAAKLAAAVSRRMEAHPDLLFEGVGISLPGRIDPITRRIMFAPNLKWSNVDLKEMVEKATGMPVELENAANACVLAEVWFGNTEHVRDMVVVTVSEGIGTGLFINGHLARGLHGMAGEFGHVSLDPDGPPCSCGARGCWEVFASSRAGLRYYAELTKSPAPSTFQELLGFAESGDRFALKALDKMAHAIGRGIRMVVTGIAPEEIVVVGEFTRMWDRYGPVVEAEAKPATVSGKTPRLRPAPDPRMARLRGTVALVLHKRFGVTQTPVNDRQNRKQPTNGAKAVIHS
ncbi:MAG TPA: ROK family transcriptional regulator [Terriglobales bacterium]|nr:ROK family transcriptional regulator [Terriglobales bacterium]